jgi:nuclear transport factor 2 (NTF2) superfamily protein
MHCTTSSRPDSRNAKKHRGGEAKLAFRDNRIAVRFAYEWRCDAGQWFRSYGNENWEFDAQGSMRLRIASINDLSIKDSDQRYLGPLADVPTIIRR